MSTIFTKIINGEIPCYKIYEDKLTFAFLDINPVNLGHTLVIPKLEVDYFLDLPDADYLAVFKTAKTVATAIQKVTKCLRVCTWVEGFAVPHFHYHVCPFYKANGEFWNIRGTERKTEELLEIQQKILKELN